MGVRLADLAETDNGDLFDGADGEAAGGGGAPAASRVATSLADAAIDGDAGGGGGGGDSAVAVGNVPPEEEFPERVPPFRGVPPSQVSRALVHPSDLSAGTNITHLSFLLYRLLITSGATSLLDVPCRAHAAWMPALLARLEYDRPAFSYTCAGGDGDRGGGTPWSAAPLPAADLVWAWAGLDDLPVATTYAFLSRVAASGSRRLAVGSWAEGAAGGGDGSGAAGGSGGGGAVSPGERHPKPAGVLAGGLAGRGGHLGRPEAPLLNLRAPPFLLNPSERVLGGLADGGRPGRRGRRKQLLVYDVKRMRDNW